jgi:RNA polymerase sigma-70 factor (ECF subfamily)
MTINNEITEHIKNAMNALSPQQKIVFTMRHYEGFKLREIAQMMQCAEGTVKKYLFSATERIRGQLRAVYP